MHGNVDMSLMVYFHFNIGTIFCPVIIITLHIALYITRISHLTNHLKSDILSMNNS